MVPSSSTVVTLGIYSLTLWSFLFFSSFLFCLRFSTQDSESRFWRFYANLTEIVRNGTRPIYDIELGIELRIRKCNKAKTKCFLAVVVKLIVNVCSNNINYYQLLKRLVEIGYLFFQRIERMQQKNQTKGFSLRVQTQRLWQNRVPATLNSNQLSFPS